MRLPSLVQVAVSSPDETSMALIIRDEQVRSLLTGRGGAHEAPLMQRLARDYPEDRLRLGDSGALALVRETIRSGLRRGIHLEADLGGLLRLYVELGPGLEHAAERDWANQVLDHPKLPGTLKVKLVSQRLFARTQGRRIVLHRDEV
jgi:hypothetical protein